ncbi:hypothetical protein N483_11100 [Pseudoalteromonas luteoviolacea NCIMB 1944]|nr:hypothetical protein N483_11100 [Pseudoalteromonas luteoviolacea NCIMB 1944]
MSILAAAARVVVLLYDGVFSFKVSVGELLPREGSSLVA